MAPLSMLGPHSDSDGAETAPYGDRGQLLLVAVLVLAASFIILALVVNSAIFTENIATRQSPPGSQDALEHRAETADAVASIIEDLNQDPSNQATSDTDIQTAIDNSLSPAELSQQGARGRILTLSYLNWNQGTIIAQQNKSRDLVGQAPARDQNPILATNVDAIRNIEFELYDVVDGSNFVFFVSGNGANTWQMRVERDSSYHPDAGVDGVRIFVDTANGTEDCTRPDTVLSDGLTIDVTGGTMAGEACHALDRDQTNGDALWFGSGLMTPYPSVEFVEGDDVTGNYSMVIDGGTPSSTYLNDINTDSDPDGPYFQDAIYNVDVNFAYATRAVKYDTGVRIAPGEAPP